MKISTAKISFPEEDRKEILGRVDEVLETGWLRPGKYVSILRVLRRI